MPDYYLLVDYIIFVWFLPKNCGNIMNRQYFQATFELLVTDLVSFPAICLTMSPSVTEEVAEFILVEV